MGCSLIKNHTQRGPKTVSKRKKIPTSGELIYWGARLINTNEKPTVIIMSEVNNKSKPVITNVAANGKANKAVNDLPNIYEGTKLISLKLLIIVM